MPLSPLQVTGQSRATRSWTRAHNRQERFPGGGPRRATMVRARRDSTGLSLTAESGGSEIILLGLVQEAT
jgi:hypothetical protein